MFNFQTDSFTHPHFAILTHVTTHSSRNSCKNVALKEAELLFSVVCQQLQQKTSSTVHNIYSSFRIVYKIRRVLERKNFAGKSASKNLLFKAKTRKQRRVWCSNRKHMTLKDWSQLVFSDKRLFKLESDGRVWVRRKPSETPEPSCTVSSSSDRR